MLDAPQIAYLSSQVTLPGSPSRRSDAFEHDLMMAALRSAFDEAGMQILDVSWDDPSIDWQTFDAAIIGTTWDYWDRLDEYLATLAKIGTHTQLWNPVELVRWNIDKRYLRELESLGAPVIPTLWFDDPKPTDVAAAFDHFGTDDLVVKRQVGASATGQYRLRRDDVVPPFEHPMLVQPFQPAIVTEGEYSFIFVDGQLSHTLNKRAADGDYRIQSEYGGTEYEHEPTPADLASAQAVMDKVIDKLETTPLYARVDMLRDDSGTLALMEAELIEPYLYPEQGPDLGNRLARAVVHRLNT